MPSGLIAKALNTDPTKTPVSPDSGNVYQAQATGYDPSLRTVDPSTQTTAGQLAGLLATDNPVMQQARAGAMQTANQRGLLNSSIAAGAGENAVIQSALPIAQSDAATYSNAAAANQGAQNTAGQFNAGNATSVNLANTGALNVPGTIGTQTQAQKSLAEQGAQLQAGTIIPAQTQAQTTLQAQSGQIQQQLQTLRGTQATDLANIEGNFRSLIQTSASATGFYSGIVGQISAVMNDPNTSAEQKGNTITNLTSMLNSGLSIIGSIGNVDLSALLNFAPTPT
jgi:hypothetical protein